MTTPGTTSLTPANDPARFAKLNPEALRKPLKLLGVGQGFVLLPLGQELALTCQALAFQVTGTYKARFPYLADDFDSAASFALVRAAAFFNPTLGFQFTTFAHAAVLRSCWDVCRTRKPRGYRVTGTEPPRIESLLDQDVATDNSTQSVDDTEQVAVIGTIMARMQPRLAEVLRRRHLEGQTLQAIGEDMGITKERVRQIELQAIMKIRESGIAG